MAAKKSNKVLDAEIVQPSTALAPTTPRPDGSLILSPVMNLEVAKKRLAEFQEFVNFYMEEGTDFGTIPGTQKPTLYKPGADKLCELYGLGDAYKILTQVEDFTADPPLFDYTIECQLWRGDRLVSTGLGSCNSYESKYKMRELQRICPACGKAAIIKGKEEYGGGWLCWKKRDGCGAKFNDGDAKIEGQDAGKIFNDDIPTLKNTILKMAKKRAKVDATLAATRSSGIFTQDMEDISGIHDADRDTGSKEKAQEVAQRKIAEHAQSPQTHSVTIEFSLDSKFLWMTGDGCAKLGNTLRAAGTQGNDGIWTVPGGDSLEMLKAMDDLNISYKEGRIYTRSCEATGKAPVATTASPAQPAAAKPPQANEAQKTAPSQPHNPMAAPPASIPEHKTVELVAGPLEHVNATRTNGGPLTTSKGAPYVTMIVGERKFFAFSNHEMSINGRDTKPLQKIITALKPGAFVAFTAHCDAKGYWNVDRVLQLGDLEWDETTGLSVLRRGDIPGQGKLL